MRRFSMVAAVLVLCLVCTADAQAGPVRNVLHRGRCVVQSVVKKTAAVVRGTVQGVRAGVASARCQLQTSIYLYESVAQTSNRMGGWSLVRSTPGLDHSPNGTVYTVLIYHVDSLLSGLSRGLIELVRHIGDSMNESGEFKGT